MKVLLLTSKPPYPSHDGGCFASARLLDNLLSEQHDVHLLTISTRKHPFNMDAIPIEIQSSVKISFVEVNTDITIPGVLASIFSSDSYNISRFYNKQLASQLNSILKENEFDAVILDSLYSTKGIDLIRNQSSAKVFIRTHNIEYKIWHDRAAQESGIIKKKYFGMLSKKLKAYEISTLNKADGILSISPVDSKGLRDNGVTADIFDFPVAIKARSGSDYNIGTQRAFHLGSMSWKPNTEAVDHLVSLWPNINEHLPMASLHIAGSGMNKWKAPRVINVIVDGFVEDLYNFANNNGILISPIRSGSGVNIKILEMMSFGVPIITTSKGAEGILDKDALIIADNDQELSKQIVELLGNAIKEEEVSKRSIEYIQKYHDPVTIGDSLTGILNG